MKSQVSRYFDSWENSNNHKYYFTSLKIISNHFSATFFFFKRRETSLESRGNNFCFFLCPRFLSTFYNEQQQQRKFLNTFLLIYCWTNETFLFECRFRERIWRIFLHPHMTVVASHSFSSKKNCVGSMNLLNQ